MSHRPARAAKRRAKRRLDHSQPQDDSENEVPLPATKRRKTAPSQSSASQSSKSSESSQSKANPKPQRRGRKRAKRHSTDSEPSDAEQDRPSKKKRRVDAAKQSKGVQPPRRRRPRANNRATEDADDADSASSVQPSDQPSSVSPETVLASNRADIVIRWLTGGESLKDKVDTIQGWLAEDEEAFSLLMLQLMLRLAGARTYQVGRAHLEGPNNTASEIQQLVKEIEESYENEEEDDEEKKDADEKEEEKKEEEVSAPRRRKRGKNDKGKPELFARGWGKLLTRYKQFITLVSDKNIATVYEDDYFYDVFLNWCKMLARHAGRRQLRRVAVHTAFYMMDGLVSHLATSRKDVLVLQRKLENLGNDASKERQRKKSEKVLEEQTDRMERIKTLTDLVLDEIVAYKYADTDAQIRQLVLKCIPIWVNTDPSRDYLLTNKWIKYLSWGLHDSDPSVRKAGLDGLDKLFHYNRKKSRSKKDADNDEIDEERLRALQALLNRYKGRILEMSNDIDAECCANAIGLLTTLLRNSLLNENEGNDVAECIFDEDVAVRQAAATFIFADSFEYFGMDEFESLADKHRQDLIELCKITRDRNSTLCRKYGKSATNRSFFEPAAFVVNELYSTLDCLRDWDTMIELLLQTEESENERDQRNMRKKKKKGGAKHAFRETEQESLCYILLASVKKACQELAPAISFGQKPSKRKLKKKDEAQMEKWYDEFVEHCAPRIPDLLKTFQSDNIKSFAIVQMIRHLPLDIFEAQEIRPKLDTMIQTLSRMFLIHEMPMRCQIEDDDDDDLKQSSNDIAHAMSVSRHFTNRVNLGMQREVMSAFEYLVNENHTYQEPVQDALLAIVDQVTDRFDELRAQFLENCTAHEDETDVKLDAEENEQIQSMFSCVSRLQHISSAVKVGKMEWNDDLSEILKAVVRSSIDEYREFLSPLIQMLNAEVLWLLQRNPDEHSFEFVEQLRERTELIQEVLDILLDEAIVNLEQDDEDEPDIENGYLMTSAGKTMEENIGRLVDILAFVRLRIESKPQLQERWKDANAYCFSEALCSKMGDFYRPVLLFLHLVGRAAQVSDSAVEDASATDPAVVFVRENMEIRSLTRCCRVGIIDPYRASKLAAVALSFIRRGIGRSKSNQWRERHRNILDGFYTRLGKLGESYMNDVCVDAMLEILRHEPVDSRADCLDNFCTLIQQKRSALKKKQQGRFVKLVKLCFNLVMTRDQVMEHMPLLPPLVRFIKMSVNRDVLFLWKDFKALESNLPRNRDNWEVYNGFREDFHKLVKKSRELREIAVESDDEDPSQMQQDAPQPASQDESQSVVFDASQASHTFDDPNANDGADENQEETEQKDLDIDPKQSKSVREQSDDGSDVEMEDTSPQKPRASRASNKSVTDDERTTPRRSPRKRKGRGRQTPRGAWVKRR